MCFGLQSQGVSGCANCSFGWTLNGRCTAEEHRIHFSCWQVFKLHSQTRTSTKWKPQNIFSAGIKSSVLFGSTNIHLLDLVMTLAQCRHILCLQQIHGEMLSLCSIKIMLRKKLQSTCKCIQDGNHTQEDENLWARLEGKDARWETVQTSGNDREKLRKESKKH